MADLLTIRRPCPRIIPCLDVRNGRVVKGVRFGALRDIGDPVQLAKAYADSGADEIVYLDIDATLTGKSALYAQIEAIRQEIAIPLTVGGGVKTLADARSLFAAGADKVTVNTAAVSRPQLISEIADAYGSQAVVVAIDAWRNPASAPSSRFQIRVRGGTVPMPYSAPLWGAMAIGLGGGELLVTCWDQDGVGRGYDLELIAAMRQAVDAPIIASGGASEPGDLDQAWRAGADAMLVASMLHDGKYKIHRLKQILLEDFNCPVRPPEALC